LYLTVFITAGKPEPGADLPFALHLLCHTNEALHRLQVFCMGVTPAFGITLNTTAAKHGTTYNTALMLLRQL